ncbi:MAG: 3',5'-cyclic-nucleotide phosphodiesterase [Gemmataceae bacterium]
MRVTLVASAPPDRPQLFTSFVLDDVVAIDAGCLDRVGDLETVSRIKHIFLTHSHLDHVASLGPFLDAVYDGSGNCVTIYGLPHTLDSLRRDVFNNALYPDFVQLSTTSPPFLKLHELTPGQQVEAGGLRITPVAVRHVVPSLGYVVEDDQAAVAFSGDTGPTEELWRYASTRPFLRAVFAECTFPSSLQWLADLALHLTPRNFAAVRAQLASHVRLIAYHLHARCREAVIAELAELKIPDIEIGEPGVTYLF